METRKATENEKTYLLAVAKNTAQKLFKKGRSAEYVLNFVHSERGRDYMAKVYNYVATQTNIS